MLHHLKLPHLFRGQNQGRKEAGGCQGPSHSEEMPYSQTPAEREIGILIIMGTN